jgi:hypothetical protein
MGFSMPVPLDTGSKTTTTEWTEQGLQAQVHTYVVPILDTETMQGSQHTS